MGACGAFAPAHLHGGGKVVEEKDEEDACGSHVMSCMDNGSRA